MRHQRNLYFGYGGIDFGYRRTGDWMTMTKLQINLEPSQTLIDGGLKLKFGGVNYLDPTFEFKITQDPKSGGLSVQGKNEARYYKK